MSNILEQDARPWTLWTFTGIHGVTLASSDRFDLAPGLELMPTSPLILSRWTGCDLSTRERDAMRSVGYYLVHKSPTDRRDPIREEQARARLLDALIAFQIVKPSATLGYVLQLIVTETTFEPMFGPAELRSPMNPGQWPSLRRLDTSLIQKVPEMIKKVDGIMSGADARKKNAINLFQLALEHHHPAIACLLAVASIETCLDSWKANDFEAKLCELLGPNTPIFPDWNMPDFRQPLWTVGDVAFDLHRLRSTIAHGNDLRKVQDRNKQSIDFRQLKEFIEERQKPSYMQLLCESSICLASQVLQKSL
jgi:hypothetical protein